MSRLVRVGSLCSGYGGLDLAVERVFGTCVAWHAEVDPAASAVLAAHWPDVPNLGDILEAQFTAAEPVDILTAGYPCQPFSLAGARRGQHDERWIWADGVFRAIRMVRPRLVVLENVAGHLSLGFGRVLGDLARIGYDARWTCVRASDVGAPHQRKRVFIIAEPADAECDGWRVQPVAEPRGGAAAVAGADGAGTPAGLTLLPTPETGLSPNGHGRRGGRPRNGHQSGAGLDAVVTSLLPTPNSSLGRGTGFPSPETARERFDRGNRFLDDAVALLPTPTVADARGTRNATAGRTDPRNNTNHDGWTLGDIVRAERWGEYAPAITRWERTLLRTAPDPTEPGSKGQPRLSARFVEWLMGLPDGWVTGLPGMKRNDALRLLGNGVVPQQAREAIGRLVMGAAQ